MLDSTRLDNTIGDKSKNNSEKNIKGKIFSIICMSIVYFITN